MKQTIDREVMNKLSKEVSRIGTMYFVFQSREPEEKRGIDVFFSKGISKEECLEMLEFMRSGIQHHIKEHYENNRI
jgi:hypothetical protein